MYADWLFAYQKEQPLQSYFYSFPLPVKLHVRALHRAKLWGITYLVISCPAWRRLWHSTEHGTSVVRSLPHQCGTSRACFLRDLSLSTHLCNHLYCYTEDQSNQSRERRRGRKGGGLQMKLLTIKNQVFITHVHVHVHRRYKHWSHQSLVWAVFWQVRLVLVHVQIF